MNLPEYEPIEPRKAAPMIVGILFTLDPPDQDGFWRARIEGVSALRRDPTRAIEAALRECVPSIARSLASGANVSIVRQP